MYTAFLPPAPPPTNQFFKKFYFWPCHTAPQLGIRPMPFALESQSLNHWIARKSLLTNFRKSHHVLYFKKRKCQSQSSNWAVCVPSICTGWHWFVKLINSGNDGGHVLVCLGRHNKQAGAGLNNRNLLLEAGSPSWWSYRVTEAKSPRPRCCQGWFLVRPFSSNFLCAHLARGVIFAFSSTSCEATSPMEVGPHLYDLI